MFIFESGFPDIGPLELGKYVDSAVDYMVVNWKPFLYTIRDGLSMFLLHSEKLLAWCPWWLLILIVFLLACKLTSWRSGIVFGAMIFLIGYMGYWESMIFTLSIVISAVLIAIVLGLILGVFISQNKTAKKIIRPILDAMQTTPSFVYLLPAIMLFSLGKVPAVFATTIYILPPVVRLTDLGINQVPKITVDAADAFGCTTMQKLFKVQIPQALPTIAAGINQTTLMSLSMVVITSMIGAKGLGLDILTAISFIDIATASEAGLCVIFIAIILDRLTQGVARQFQKEKSYREKSGWKQKLGLKI